MEEHLQRGCAECTEMRRLWERVDAAALREPAYEPSPEIVAVTRDYIADTRLPDHEKAPAVLVFDSVQEAAATGVRSAAAPVRQLLYRSGTLWIDLRLEFTTESDRTLLVGQILDATRPPRHLRPRLWLIHDDERVPAAVSNRAGEFAFEFNPTENLELAVVLEGRGSVRIPLGEITSPKRAPGTYGPGSH